MTVQDDPGALCNARKLSRLLLLIVSKGLRSQLRGVPTRAKDFNIANVFRSMSSQ